MYLCATKLRKIYKKIQVSRLDIMCVIVIQIMCLVFCVPPEFIDIFIPHMRSSHSVQIVMLF